MLTKRENYLRAARFEGPEYIPCVVAITGASFETCGQDMIDVVARHPSLFPDMEPEVYAHLRMDPPEVNLPEMVDPWGCKWERSKVGMVGLVTEHPLADYSALADYEPPPTQPQNAQRLTGTWDDVAGDLASAGRRGDPALAGLYHGFFFMRLTYLRGFENFMLDLIDRPPELSRMMDMVRNHCAEMVRHFVAAGVDVLHCGDDLGAQKASILSPKMFAEFITPVYKELFAPAREATIPVYLHSDGHVLELMDQFIEAGIDIVNVQDLVNGIDNLATEVKDKLCIDLDIDRQRIVPFAGRNDIRDLIEREVRTLGSAAGGLMLRAGIYPPTPPENVDAICEAMEEFRTFYR